MNLAKQISTWSKDPSTKIGSVIVGSKGQILSQGYNGFPRGVTDEETRYMNKGEKYRLIVHGEMNAILNAALSGTRIEGATLFVYGLPPCCECTKAIIQSGISEVLYTIPEGKELNDTWKESFVHSATMLREAGITVNRWYITG